jgi:hypothetical protein
MRREEVEAIIGVPPGTYVTGPIITPGLCFLPPGDLWISDEGIIAVVFDEDARARHISYHDSADYYSIPRGPGLLDRILARLGI